jgi:glycine cleavage system H protein
VNRLIHIGVFDGNVSESDILFEIWRGAAGSDLPDALESFGSVESVKAVSEIFTPVAGEIIEVNDSLQDEPEKVNADAYGNAWMIRVRMKDKSAADALLSAAEYEDFIKAETE